MGEPVRILDLAARPDNGLSGLTPEKDIAIEFTGLRPAVELLWELYRRRGRKIHPEPAHLHDAAGPISIATLV